MTDSEYGEHIIVRSTTRSIPPYLRDTSHWKGQGLEQVGVQEDLLPVWLFVEAATGEDQEEGRMKRDPSTKQRKLSGCIRREEGEDGEGREKDRKNGGGGVGEWKWGGTTGTSFVVN